MFVELIASVSLDERFVCMEVSLVDRFVDFLDDLSSRSHYSGTMLAGTIDTELRSEYAAFIPRGNDNNNIGEPRCSFLPRRPEYK